MSKRKSSDIGSAPQKRNLQVRSNKHTLDSDEEDSGDEERYNIMEENDIEGEEEGVSGLEGVKLTPFNMKEELEEGHFDREGHFQWDKTKEIRDNWLDNIDWIKVKTDKNYIEKTNRGLADSSDSDDDNEKNFNEMKTYKNILEFMLPGETIKKTLQRLGSKTAKLSSVERWKRKKAGIIDENAELITKLTEMSNDILTNTGNMDIYQETYEEIKKKVKQKQGKKVETNETLDMYADDFGVKEKKVLVDEPVREPIEEKPSLAWEYKWTQKSEEIHGPFTTQQMQKWVDEGFFKSGVFVRKVGESGNFYSSNRIDFELYI